jgi:UDP-glucose 4-epimerase
MRHALKGADALLHYASTTNPGSAHGQSVFDVESNLVGTLNLLRAAAFAGVPQVIFASSGGTVYGRPIEVPIPETHPCAPLSSYGIVKRAIENYIESMSRDGAFRFTILRYGNPYGPRQCPEGSQGAVAVFSRKILLGEPIALWGDGAVVRDFIYIADLVEATVRALHSQDAVNCTLNIGTGTGVSIRELISRIETVAGRKAVVQMCGKRPMDVPVNVLSIGEAKRRLAWVPEIPLEEGLAITINWVRTHLYESSLAFDSSGLARLAETVAAAGEPIANRVSCRV